MNDDQLLQYGKEQGLFGLSPGEVNEKDPGYYNIIRRRGLDNQIFRRKLDRLEQALKELIGDAA